VNGRIICIGNRFIEVDAAGPAVYDRLLEMAIPPGVQLIEGGLAGLNLLPHLERGGRVVFVDAVRDCGQPGEVALLGRAEIEGVAVQSHHDHGAGLPYVLAVLPRVADGPLPEEIFLVGLEGECSMETIDRAARLSIAVAEHGLSGRKEQG
jgi:hydrogenase maturation protease